MQFLQREVTGGCVVEVGNGFAARFGVGKDRMPPYPGVVSMVASWGTASRLPIASVAIAMARKWER